MSHRYGRIGNAVDIMENLPGVVFPCGRRSALHAANLRDTVTGIFPALQAMTPFSDG